MDIRSDTSNVTKCFSPNFRLPKAKVILKSETSSGSPKHSKKVNPKHAEFYKLCNKHKIGSEHDKNLLIQILCSRIKPTKIHQESLARADVTVKKILRTSRYFYDSKLDKELHYKSKRNKSR